MNSEYKSKIDFLLAKSKTTKRSHPPQRKGEAVGVIHLWNTVHENLEHLRKTFSHWPSGVQLQLAEIATFEHYCKSIHLFYLCGPLSKADELLSGGSDEIDVFRNYDPMAKTSTIQRNGNNTPVVPKPSIPNLQEPAANVRVHAGQAQLPASAVQNLFRPKTFFDGDPRRNVSNDRQQYTGTSPNPGTIPQSGVYIPVSGYGQSKAPGILMGFRSWEETCFRHSYIPPPGAQKPDAAYPQILSLLESFCKQVPLNPAPVLMLPLMHNVELDKQE